MDIKEQKLPGIGAKFTIETDAGERLTIVLENTGHREVSLCAQGVDDACTVRLSEADAKMIGVILVGAAPVRQ